MAQSSARGADWKGAGDGEPGESGTRGGRGEEEITELKGGRGRARAVVDARARAREAPGEAGLAGAVSIHRGLGRGAAFDRGDGEIQVEVGIGAVTTLNSGGGELRGVSGKDPGTAGVGEGGNDTMLKETTGELTVGRGKKGGVALSSTDVGEGGAVPNAVGVGITSTA